MRYLEVRRHSMRIDLSHDLSHLSQAGVRLARQVGETMGPHDLVITSILPRAFETAIAMGFAVQRQYEQLNTFGEEDPFTDVRWSAGFAEIARGVRRGGAIGRFAQAQADLWRSITQTMPEGGRGLVITHGGFIEAGTAGCLPSLDHRGLGPACNYCEGVLLTFDGGTFAEVASLRVDRVSE